MIDRFINVIEKTAGVFLAAITALTFTSIMLRGTFGFTIPDWYDISRLMLGVAIFWGIASTSYRGNHIQVDILWEMLGPRGRRVLDIIATLIVLAFMAAFSWMLMFKVRSGFASGEATYDLRLLIWPFHLLAALGIFATTVLLVIRLVRLFRGTETGVPTGGATP